MVTTVIAQSSSNNGPITYAIAGGNVGSTFHIDESLGVIRVAGEVDYEMTTNFHLWIQATERSNTLLSAYKELTITISDQNDNTPRFQEGVYITSAKENIPESTTIFTVSATDADSGDNGKVVYVLAGGNVNNIQDTFSVDSNSGEIKTRVTLDRETQDSYNLIIEAHDLVSKILKPFMKKFKMKQNSEHHEDCRKCVLFHNTMHYILICRVAGFPSEDWYHHC